MFGQHPLDLSLQIADAVAQESKLGLERLDAGLNEGTLAADVLGPGGSEDVMVLLDQRQRFLVDWTEFGEKTFDILRREVRFESGILLQFKSAGSFHPSFVCFYVRRKGGKVLVPVFCPQVGFLVEDEEVAQLLQAHGVDVFEQDRILPLEVIDSHHDKLLMNVR